MHLGLLRYSISLRSCSLQIVFGILHPGFNAFRHGCQHQQPRHIMLSCVMFNLVHQFALCLPAQCTSDYSAIRHRCAVVHSKLFLGILHPGFDALRHCCQHRQHQHITLSCAMFNFAQRNALCLSARCISASVLFGISTRLLTHAAVRHHVPYRVDGARGDPVHQRHISRRRFVRLNLCDIVVASVPPLQLALG